MTGPGSILGRETAEHLARVWADSFEMWGYSATKHPLLDTKS